MAPIRVRYYRLYNLDNTDTAIYPQLREIHEPKNNIFWNGEDAAGGKYQTPGGQVTTVDLDTIGLPLNVPFFLGWTIGKSKQNAGWALEQDFFVAGDSDLVATAIWRGSAEASTFEYMGTKTYKQHSAGEIDNEVENGANSLDDIEEPPSWKYIGILIVLSTLPAAIKMTIGGLIAVHFANQGYNTEIDIGSAGKVSLKIRKSGPGSEAVPPAVQKIWNKSYDDAKAKFPREVLENGGISEIE